MFCLYLSVDSYGTSVYLPYQERASLDPEFFTHAQHCCEAQKKLHTALAGAALPGQSFREFCLSVLAGYNLEKSHESWGVPAGIV